MAPPPPPTSKFTRGHGAADGQDSPSNNLWVGNLSADTSDSDLMELFIKYGALDSVTTYLSRSYAFVFFKRVEDAKAAKDALQGATLRGNPIKIEFARPAKPCKHLWVGGISPTVSKEELEEEFLKFGKVEDFKFLRDKNTAFVEYFRLEDASQAMKNLNGKQIGGEQIRVDFLRSQPSRREQWPNSQDLRDGHLGRGTGFSDIHSAYKRPHPQSSAARKGDGQPSKILWVGYPPSVQVDEQMLHNAMILFGEIERIKSFPSRHYSFVEFRSVDEARRAKEGLQGRLFNDPRITIMFSSSDLAPGKDYPGSHPVLKGPRPEMFVGDHQLRPPQMDMLGPSHQMMPNSFSGQLQPAGAHGPNMTMRSFGGHGNFEPMLSGSESKDFHGMQETNPKSLELNWRRPSPSPGMRSSPVPGIRQPMRHQSGSWDVSDASQFQRDPKRSRIDSSLSIDDAAFPSRRIDEHGLGFEQPYGLGPVSGGGASGAFMNVQGRSRLSPVGAKVAAEAIHIDNDCIWRGIIAKGGTPVCHARCVPIGKGIGSELPEVVNCSARTGLDMLAKHYAEAIGFEIVFFLPDSEDDFASYTEFLRYLGSKNRAGVAKFDDGTTLFLVPPSDFLTKVLNVLGPERLYGVVLKLPQQPLHSAQTIERQNFPPLHAEHSLTRLKEELVLPVDYGRFSHDDPKVQLKPQFLHGSESVSMQPSSVDYGSNSANISQAGISLTPELIATLASLIPATTQSAEGAQATSVSSTIRPLLPEHAGRSVEQLGSQFNPQAQPSQIHSYTSLSSHSAQMAPGSTQYQELTVGMPQQGAVSSRPLNNFTVAPQSAHIAVPPVVSQQNQFAVPPSTQKGYGMVHGTDASTLYSSPAVQQVSNPTAASNQVNLGQPQNIMSLSADRVSLEHPNQMQQLQSVLSGAGQGTSEDEIDKNQRYQSTLQFAANLLLQIQNQQQQQTSTPTGRGTGNQL